MNDPIVKSLTYQLETDDSLIFDAPPLSFSTDSFDIELKDDVLKVSFKEELSSLNEAKNFIQDFLNAWKIKTELNYGIHTISFSYLDAEVIDRDPPKPGDPIIIMADVASSVAVGGNATFRMTRKQYPKPPLDFKLSPDVKTLWDRYRNYKKNQESIFSMAYFCYTVVKQDKSLNKISKRYEISQSILKKIRELSSTKGDRITARKYTAMNTPSSSEIRWIEHAVRAIIKQVAVIEAGSSPEKLTMNDLPSLE